jgi:tetratricopeptide (TPR) repeat protein
MADPAVNADLLRGKQVAFTGRLALLTRSEAADLLAGHGGILARTVNRHTSFLIVGRAGWPLQKDGRLTQKLRQAQALQRSGSSLRILHEHEWLNQLGLESVDAGIHRLYTTTQIAQFLKIPPDRLRRWVKTGLIQPAETRQGICYFDYSQVADARTLHGLTQAGVKPQRIRQSLQQLAQWLGNVERPLAQLSTLEQSGELLVRWQEDLVEPTGQRRLDFSDPLPHSILGVDQGSVTTEQLYEAGCAYEDSGRPTEAAEAYNQALVLGGPTRDIAFNLANVLYSLGHREQALDRLYQVLELDGNFVEAWNNLGVLLQELGRPKEAMAAFQQALKINPRYADAHYNLADLLEETGRAREARAHWKIFVRQDPQSPWGRHARARLGSGS